MAANSPKELIKIVQWVDPDAHAAAVDIADVDSEIDTIGYRYAVVVVNVGVNTLTTWDIQVEAASATGGSFSNVTGAVFNLVGATDDDAVYTGIIDLQGSAGNLNRFIQLNGVATGGTSAYLGVTLLLVGPKDTAESDYIAYTDPTFEV